MNIVNKEHIIDKLNRFKDFISVLSKAKMVTFDTFYTELKNKFGYENINALISDLENDKISASTELLEFFNQWWRVLNNYDI